MSLSARCANTGGCSGTRQSPLTTVTTILLVLALTSQARAMQAGSVATAVREERGVYTVTAEFTVPVPAQLVLDTLTDYDNISRFMPAVRASKVVEQGNGYAVVEQEAVASFLMLSKRIHLMLEVRERAGTVHFLDRCGRSFERYEGTWSVTEHAGGSVIVYRLTANPSFEVPGFLLKRLLKRDAVEMIGHLQSEISARAYRR